MSVLLEAGKQSNKTTFQGHSLQDMVSAHYDNRTLMNLEGEIHFDRYLSIDEVKVVLSSYQKFTDHEMPEVVYAPCAGTLRHVSPLLERGVRRVIAVDLSHESLAVGRERFCQGDTGQVQTYNTDIRDTDRFAQNHDIPLAFLMGNSLGDVTDSDGHLEFIEALGKPLKRGGVLVFDYMGERYNPPVGEVYDTTWPDRVIDGDIEFDVFDRRQRWSVPNADGTSTLHLTCEVTSIGGELIVPKHSYDKLVVPDPILIEQFARFGMKLHCLGPLRNYSSYHDRRIREKDDLGMMGTPDHLYVAVKE
ncbi:class I SAM-dependent methyltransferase [Candidatus Daviesbacteria bacterium]|nr:class I SAM-dependent methyltransferase [Candidatus Daviesbacteria bacterium]